MTFYWIVMIFVAFGAGTQVDYWFPDDDDKDTKKDANRGNGQRLNH